MQREILTSFSRQALGEILTKFFVEVRKKDGSKYELKSLRVMQASLDRHLRQKNYPVSIISGREFKKSQETLNSEAKVLQFIPRQRKNDPTELGLTVEWTKNFQRQIRKSQ